MRRLQQETQSYFTFDRVEANPKRFDDSCLLLSMEVLLSMRVCLLVLVKIDTFQFLNFSLTISAILMDKNHSEANIDRGFVELLGRIGRLEAESMELKK